MSTNPFPESSEPSFSNGAETSPCSLLVIERDEARIFQALAPGTNAVTIPLSRPPFPTGGNSNPPGQAAPAQPDEFAAIIESLNQAGRILLFRSGPGADTQIERLMAWAEAHRADLTGRIAASIRLHDRFLTNNHLLTTARNFMHGPG